MLQEAAWEANLEVLHEAPWCFVKHPRGALQDLSRGASLGMMRLTYTIPGATAETSPGIVM